MDDFLVRALLAGAGVALAAGPLGCFVVWRRMAYFGDSLAHSALLGIALGLALGIDLTLGILVCSVSLALGLWALERQRRLPGDTLLGILSHAALSLGLVAIGRMEGVRVDLLAFLFGDILAVTVADLVWIYAAVLVALAALALLWRPLLATTVHTELAAAEGVPVHRVRLAFMILIALVVAAAMKVVGVVLVTSLMILPAAAARRFARTPEQMAIAAGILGVAAVAGGIGASWRWDSPSGPSVVLAGTAIFALSLILGSLRDIAASDG